MKTRFTGLAKACALLALFALGLVWSAPVLAEDAATFIPVALSAQERPVRLPAMKLGEIRSGYVMVITENGMASPKPAVLTQQMSKPSGFTGFCVPR